MNYNPTIVQKLYSSSIAEFGTSAPLAAILCYRQAQIQLDMSEQTKTQSVGEQRVRTTFNPSQDDTVSQIKQKSAELINLCEELMGETTTFSCRVPKVKKQELINYVAVKLAEWSQGSA